MIELTADEVAAACNGERLSSGVGTSRPGFPERAAVDSRGLKPGDLFVGLKGATLDGGSFAVDALQRGAWGVVAPLSYAQQAADAGTPGHVIAVDDPAASLAALAAKWRACLSERGCKVVGITGSVGKTSTKDILAALLGKQLTVHASPLNYNTEIGLPLAILGASGDTQCLILEMAMRGEGQIAELAAVARPNVGLITNIAAVHLELLGSIEAVAAAKAELLGSLPVDGVAVIPVDEPLLVNHLPAGRASVTFGRADSSATLRLLQYALGEQGGELTVAIATRHYHFELSVDEHHNLLNATAALAAAYALGLDLGDLAGRVEVDLSPHRGQTVELPGLILVIDDCYNANPMSMRSALENLATHAVRRRASGQPARCVAVLGEMAELGRQSELLHSGVAEHVERAGVELLVTVGELAVNYSPDGLTETHHCGDAEAAADLIADLTRPGDLVLVKGSRCVGLERVSEHLRSSLGVV